MSLTKYVIRRALFLIPVFFGITLLVFSIERLAGDPVHLLTILNPKATEIQLQSLRAYFGLDQPIHIQYIRWLVELFSGNLGTSYALYQGVSVSDLIAQRTWLTLELQLLGLVLSLAMAIPIGVLSAKKRYS